jgi:adenylate cyclase
VAIRKAVAQQNRDEPEPLAVRIGLHAGEPVLEEGDYFGLVVVIAKRLCDAVDGAGILVSDAVRSLATNVPAADRVELVLKGFADTTVAWRIAD